MNRAMLLAAALVLASAANAADEPTPGTPKKTSTKPPSKSSTKASKDKPGTGKTPQSQKERASSPEPTASQAQLAEVFRAKTNLLFAVESCERPDRCDKQLRAESEERFMKACLECAPQERCEADRQTIRDGNGKRTYNPCSVK